jgi:GT2 family glycosyltransferase
MRSPASSSGALEIIAVPILASGEKLLQHFRSIDVPVKRYFIIDNSCGSDASVTDAIDEIWDTKPDHIGEIQVLTNCQNQGYAGSVNQVFHQNMDCKYWLVTNFDMYLEPGEWDRVLFNIETFEHGATLGTGNDEFIGTVFTHKLIGKVGYLDENFYPAYYDDNDYRYRCKLAGVKMANFPTKYVHETSHTINNNAHYKRRNSTTFQSLANYYFAKWGGMPGREEYKTPFNKHLPIDYWRYDPHHNQLLRWI